MSSHEDLFRIAAKALVVRDDRYLLLTRAAWKEGMSLYEKYDIPGGHLTKSDQSLNTTLQRELHEELGLGTDDYTVTRCLGTFVTDVYTRNERHIVTIYLVTMTRESVWTAGPEHARYEWVSRDELAIGMAKYGKEFVMTLNVL